MLAQDRQADGLGLLPPVVFLDVVRPTESMAASNSALTPWVHGSLQGQGTPFVPATSHLIMERSLRSANPEEVPHSAAFRRCGRPEPMSGLS